MKFAPSCQQKNKHPQEFPRKDHPRETPDAVVSETPPDLREAPDTFVRDMSQEKVIPEKPADTVVSKTPASTVEN